MKKKYINESQRLFERVYKLQSDKIRQIPETIFENFEYFNENEMYNNFIDSKYYDLFISENSEYNKRQIISDFIMEAYSSIFYDVKNKLETDGTPSFTQSFLLENTLIMFPSMAKSELNESLFLESLSVLSTEPRYNQLMEEGLIYGAGAAAGTIAMGGTPLLAAGLGIGTTLAIELFMPTRWSLAIDKRVVGFVTSLTRLLAGTGSMLGKNLGTLKDSQHVIENFDNLDMNKDLIKIFERIGSRHQFNTGGPNGNAQSLGVIVEKCVEANKDIFAKDNFFTSDIKNTNIYRNVLNSMFINTGNRNNTNGQRYDKLLKYRKCVANSLADVYKFTLIANLKDQPNYERITNAIGHGFVSQPNQILNFIDSGNPQAREIKENLLDLIKLRMIINDMINTFRQGTFDIDKEAGLFLEQKMKATDREILDYLKSSKTTHDNVFQNKEYNSIPGKSGSVFNKKYTPINNTMERPNLEEKPIVEIDTEKPAEEEKPSRLNFM